MSLDVIVGLQRGDEGKGRFVDLAAVDYDVIARANGGANAGHTVIPKAGREALALHQVPAGVAYPGKLNIIGSGVYLDPVRLLKEIDTIRAAGLSVTPDNLKVSAYTHLVLPHHIMLDSLREAGAEAQGSTKSGIAFVAADKYLRVGVRLETIMEPNLLYKHVLEGLKEANQHHPKADQKTAAELTKIARDWLKLAKTLKPYMSETTQLINEYLRSGKRILVEGANAFWLDVTHGMYPAVTSSATTVNGLLDGLGLAPKHVGKVTGIVKAVKSHVGGGPLVTEISDHALATKIRGPLGKKDSEYGVTSKRPRRIGYPDLVELRNAIQLNGVEEIALSKLDHVPRYGQTVQIATSYTHKGQQCLWAPTSALALSECTPNYRQMPTWREDLSTVRRFADLPAAAADFVKLFADELGVPVTKVGVGPERRQVIV